MKIKVERTLNHADYTMGRLYLNGVYFCDTLEDCVRNLPEEKKIPGRTAIPAGVYRVLMGHSPKFGRRLPRVQAVPWFEGILIHRGNRANNTAGCILVGQYAEAGVLKNSTRHEQELVKLLEAENEITLEVVQL